MTGLGTLELTLEEARVLVALTRARHGELDRMMQSMEEGEGMDLQRHNALKTMRPQLEALSDLLLKLEGILRDLESAKRASR